MLTGDSLHFLGGTGSTVHIMCGKHNDTFSVGACTGSMSKRYIEGCKKNYIMNTQKALKRKVKYLPPGNVQEFGEEILEAGTQLASLVKVDFPNADLISAALYDVILVVKNHRLKGNG